MLNPLGLPVIRYHLMSESLNVFPSLVPVSGAYITKPVTVPGLRIAYLQRVISRKAVHIITFEKWALFSFLKVAYAGITLRFVSETKKIPAWLTSKEDFFPVYGPGSISRADLFFF